ncbi:MAG TPA: zf-HC2 domain-containing protein [Blastocatellia bacterium]|nr:zf-HC2 domain-containing protein [Blastocatellia bacterium]
MECNKYKLTASAYIDRQLDEQEAARYREHVAWCEGCRIHLMETEQVSLILRRAEPPTVPQELRGYVMHEAARRAANEISFSERAVEWLLKLNPQLVAYAAGVIVSIISFGALFASFKPIPVSGIVATQAAVSIPVVNGSDQEFHIYNDLSPDDGMVADQHYYELPRVLDDGALVSFSNAAYRVPGDEAMAAMVEVMADGRASLVDVLGEPKDPRVMEELWWSLQDRTFQPALVSGRPVSTRIILLVEKVDVRG